MNLVGESTREVQVVVDRAQLEAYHLSLANVVDALRKENVDFPAGSADRGATEAMVRVAARGRGAAEIARIPVKRAGATTIFVSDLAQVIGRRRAVRRTWRCSTRRRRSRSTS